MGKLSPRIPREHNKYHGYIVRGTSHCPLNSVGNRRWNFKGVEPSGGIFFFGAYELLGCVAQVLDGSMDYK